MNIKKLTTIGLSFLFVFILFDSEARRRTEEKIKNNAIKTEEETDLDIKMEEEEATQTAAELSGPSLDDETFDIEHKKKEVIDLVKKGINFLKQKPLYEAFHSFTMAKEFKRGDLYLFVYDLKGDCMAHGMDESSLWENVAEQRDPYGTPIFKEMLKAVKNGGGWVTYQWRHATKLAYVQSVNKDGEEFIVGSGFCPHSKESSVINLVKGAVAVFNRIKEANRPIDEAFSTFSYPLGRFVLGDLYLVANSFEGVTMAHGERPGLIGTNTLDYRDEKGTYVTKEVINKLRKTSEGVWIEYWSKRSPKRAYSEKVSDRKGKEYYISCGYHPDANQKQVIDLVRKGYTFMKAHGLSEAVDEFSDLANKTFRYGDLYLVVFDFKGICKAHGMQRDLIGRNMYNDKDENGRYFVREIIDKANGGGGWISYKQNNLFKLVYVEPIDLGIHKFIITSGLYPISKMETMILLAKSAASYLRITPTSKSLHEFIDPEGRFMRGDLSVFVFESTGICLAFGDDYDLIWKKMIDVKDDKGKPYIKMLINTGMRGSGKVSFTLNGVPAIAYVEKVEKEGRTFIVGSHYYK